MYKLKQNPPIIEQIGERGMETLKFQWLSLENDRFETLLKNACRLKEHFKLKISFEKMLIFSSRFTGNWFSKQQPLAVMMFINTEREMWIWVTTIALGLDWLPENAEHFNYICIYIHVLFYGFGNFRVRF